MNLKICEFHARPTLSTDNFGQVSEIVPAFTSASLNAEQPKQMRTKYRMYITSSLVRKACLQCFKETCMAGKSLSSPRVSSSPENLQNNPGGRLNASRYSLESWLRHPKRSAPRPRLVARDSLCPERETLFSSRYYPSPLLRGPQTVRCGKRYHMSRFFAHRLACHGRPIK